MIQGRGYTIPINGLSTGTTNDANLIAIVAATDKPLAINYVSGHFRNGDSGENVSFGLIRASASTAGNAITIERMNPDDTTAGFTASDTPTSVTLTGSHLAVFGGNGGSNWQWYPSNESGSIILKPADILVLELITAPTSALTMQGVIGVEEI